jgi:HD-like signal output (HDOD) protein/prolyl-tRNA editing enzyme YbaK/EbsC (Cys-tRNA(Pro) deacylase)
MAIAGAVIDYMHANRVAYRVLHHTRTQSLIQAADAAMVPHHQIARGVVLKDDRGMLLAVLPLSHLLDFSALRALLQRDMEVADLHDVAGLFKDCEAGSVPPLGEPYRLEMIVDNSLAEPDNIYFEAGDHAKLIHVSSEDFQLLCGCARSGGFARPSSRLEARRQDTGSDATAKIAGLYAVEDFTPAIEVKRRVQQLYDLPPMPEMALRILELRRNPNASAADLARVVELDPSFAATVTRYACSPLYAYRGKINSIHDAIARVLGYDMVMNIALGLAAGKSLKNPPDGPLGLNAFWRHATYSAALVQALVQAMPKALRPGPGMAYLAGLLHNFGFLLLGHLFQPEFYLLNKLVATNPGIPVTELEKHVLGMGQAQEVMGMGHAVIGAWLMQSWNMPEEIIVALREHHNEGYDGEHAVFSRLVLIADCLLKGQGIGDATCSDLPESVLHALGLDQAKIEAIFMGMLSKRDDLEYMSRLLAA